jgi:hypothetical protein
MRLKVYEGERSGWQPFESSTIEVERSDPLANQVEHFAAVLEAARTGAPVDVAAGS